MILLSWQLIRKFAHARSDAMVQLNYDEIRLLRELKNSERRIAGNKLDVGLERLVMGGYATTFHPNVSETLYSITTKGWAALHEAEGND